eukprot:TRINITY_DN5708_c0_g1_i1.p1 TRINITY_DN5708_c0_g1~~TRINITY_DN5708_c0_g1_i1.p1  ORF type:complete len:520 (+),score=162.47 TRINITY_DN5708_c0_g1_i1:54-1562(+)
MSILLGIAALAAAGRPNLLFMMADQMRWDAIGAHGAGTPNIDRLADEGVKFAKAYTSTPTCTPARAALLTGQKPWNHGMLGYGVVAPRYPVEMPRSLAAAGYSTHSIGKDHFGWNKTINDGIPHGYQTTTLYDGLTAEDDEYHQWFERLMPGKIPEDGWPTLDYNSWNGAPYVYNESLHPTAWTGRLAVEFLNKARTSINGSWFLKVSFHRPHSPYDPPARIYDNVTAADLPPIYTAEDGWDTMFKGVGCGPQNADAWCGLMPEPNLTVSRRGYYGSVRFVDEWVGKIYGALEANGFLEETVVLWTSDHGDGQGDHYHWRKGYPYELSAHVPMIVRWPSSMKAGIARGTVVPDAVVELRDVFPTMLDAAGAAAAPTVDGASLLCFVDSTRAGCPPQWREWLDLEHSTCYNETNHWNALTDGRMKYVFNAFFPAEQLFNITADPHELRELSTSPEYQQQLSLWRQRMVNQFEQEQRGPVWVKDGVLQQRTKGQTYSPNYPGNQ